jgi:hypothetical protein
MTYTAEGPLDGELLHRETDISYPFHQFAKCYADVAEDQQWTHDDWVDKFKLHFDREIINVKDNFFD